MVTNVCVGGEQRKRRACFLLKDIVKLGAVGALDGQAKSQQMCH